MKAIVFEQYGPPDVLQLKEVPKPTPKDNEVLINVQAASTNPADWHVIRGKPFLVRLDAGLTKPKHPIPGHDIAGRVETVGSRVAQFRPGDDVFGMVNTGGFADYVCATEDQLAQKPANVTFEAAAAVPIVGFTAVQGLRDHGQLQRGQQVLINGASGGVGTFAVQYAKALGAEVTGVCSTRNLDLVRSIGADHVVDYTQQDFTRTGQQYDLLFDAVGNRSAADYQRALKPDGICVVTGFTTMSQMVIQVMLLGSWISRTGSRKIGSMGIAQPNQPDLLIIQELLASGQVVPVLDRTYPLSETADAIRYLETGRARGKVVLTLAAPDQA